jgi:hypothetical protein
VRLGLSLLGIAVVAVLVAFALHSRPPLDEGTPQAGKTTGASTPTPTHSATPGPEETGAEPTGEPSPVARPTAVESAVAAPKLPLLVLNNSRLDGLADRAAADFRSGGWTVRGTGNFRGRIAATTVYYEPGQEASARRLAAQFSKVLRVLPRFAGLPGSGLTVVVTRDYVGR